MRRWVLGLGTALLLAACRYTFWPLIPPEVPFPQRFSAVGTLEAAGEVAAAHLNVRRVPEAGYLEARWYRDETLLLERSLFVEAPRTYALELPLGEPGLYRLVLVWREVPVLQLDLGTPQLPTPPETPGPGEG